MILLIHRDMTMEKFMKMFPGKILKYIPVHRLPMYLLKEDSVYGTVA